MRNGPLDLLVNNVFGVTSVDEGLGYLVTLFVEIILGGTDTFGSGGKTVRQ